MTSLYDATGALVQVWDSAGRLIWGEPPTPPDPPVPPSGPLLNVARRCSAVGMARTPGSVAGTFAETAHTLVVDVIDPVVEWVAVQPFASTATGGIVRAAARINGGAMHPITWGGQTSVRIDVPVTAPITLTSDPLPLQGHAGDALILLAWIDPDEAGAAPSDLTSVLITDPGVGAGAWQTTPALSPTTSPGAVLTGGTWSLRPSRITAPSDQASWIVVGDSIMQQTWSWGEQAMDRRGLAAVKSAMGGDAYQYYPGRWPSRVGAHVPHVTSMLDQFGINDTGAEPLVIAARALAFWRKAEGDGINTIVKSTLTLSASSSDGWATLEGQNPSGSNPTRSVFNDWLRDGAPLTLDGSTPVDAGTVDAIRCTTISPDGTVTTRAEGHPLAAVTDVVAAIESSPNSGKYALGAPCDAMQGWADGLHPSPGIHAILAERAARDLALLGL